MQPYLPDTLEAAHAEIRRLFGLMCGEPKLINLTYTSDEGIEFVIEHWGVKLLAASVVDTFRHFGGINFVTTVISDGDIRMEVTVRPLRNGVKSTSEVLDELREENAMLQRQLDEVRA